MRVAEVEICASPGFMTAGFVHKVSYSDLGIAETAYHYVADLLEKKSNKANDLPTTVELVGINRLSVLLEHIHSVSLTDLVLANQEERGMREAYPNLNWK